MPRAKTQTVSDPEDSDAPEDMPEDGDEPLVMAPWRAPRDQDVLDPNDECPIYSESDDPDAVETPRAMTGHSNH
jgi:hypothetical protein